MVKLMTARYGDDVHCKDLPAHLMRRGQANILRYVMLIDVVSLTFKI